MPTIADDKALLTRICTEERQRAYAEQYGTLDPRWLTSAVVDLIASYNADPKPGTLAILVDALMDAGCDDDMEAFRWLAEAKRVPHNYDVGYIDWGFWNAYVDDFMAHTHAIPMYEFSVSANHHTTGKTAFLACLALSDSWKVATDDYRERAWQMVRS